MQILYFGKSPQLSLNLARPKSHNHRLALLLNRSRALIAQSSNLFLMDGSSLNSNLLVLDKPLGNLHQFSSPLTWWLREFAQIALTKAHPPWYLWPTGPLNFRFQPKCPDQDPAYKRPIILRKKGVSGIIKQNFFLQSKLLSQTGGFLIDCESFIKRPLPETPGLNPKIEPPWINFTL